MVVTDSAAQFCHSEISNTYIVKTHSLQCSVQHKVDAHNESAKVTLCNRNTYCITNTPSQLQGQGHICEWCCHGNEDSSKLPITPAPYCSFHHPDNVCMPSPTCTVCQNVCCLCLAKGRCVQVNCSRGINSRINQYQLTTGTFWPLSNVYKRFVRS